MALHWKIDSRRRLVCATAEGAVTLDDALSYFRAVAGAHALSYRKVLDFSGGTSGMSADEMMILIARIRDYHGQGTMGALAIVSSAEQSITIARLLGAMAMAERPMKLFTSRRTAKAWIEQQAA
jgi:hypothetical protein